jgi:hypothetical protein
MASLSMDGRKSSGFAPVANSQAQQSGSKPYQKAA